MCLASELPRIFLFPGAAPKICIVDRVEDTEPVERVEGKVKDLLLRYQVVVALLMGFFLVGLLVFVEYLSIFLQLY